jgi:AmmeMemoRadiSam system protein B
VVPPNEQAIELGANVAKIVSGLENRRIVCLASTDLTHYGPRYGFVPKGTGPKAIEWAQNVNDKEFIDLALQLKPADMLASAARNGNACGPGAAAATVSAAKNLGCDRGLLLAQTSSSKVMQEKMDTTSTESVGYAAIVF